MKNTTRNALIGVIAAVGLIIIIAAVATTQPHRKCDTICKYGTEAVEVLEKYKKSTITSEEAESRINKLVKTMETAENKTKTDEEHHRLFMMRMALVSMRVKFMATGYVPYYEVEEAINKINKNIKE